MDFVQVIQRRNSKGEIELLPDFLVTQSADLMIRGSDFYAVWDEQAGLWTRDELRVSYLVDKLLWAEKEELVKSYPDTTIRVHTLRGSLSGSWARFKSYLVRMPDNYHDLDPVLHFADERPARDAYASRRLSYSPSPGDCSAYEELIGTLYTTEEKEKLEWAAGAVLAGASSHIQKFVVLYGSAGSGKSTFLSILQQLFDGYYATFDAGALGSRSNQFATDVFKHNPLVAIQHDGDLSRIEDNTLLNSIISHEEILVNEKYKPAYPMRVNAFLFMGTNRPVRITDAKSGIIRRLIDVRPSGDILPPDQYEVLRERIKFEVPHIAHKLRARYLELGPNRYSDYRPIEMMEQTDYFLNYVREYEDQFMSQDGTTLNQAWALYKEYIQGSAQEFALNRVRFREELKNYFKKYYERYRNSDGSRSRNVYRVYLGYDKSVPRSRMTEKAPSISLLDQESLLDDILADCPAQYATKDETPRKKWEQVTTTLSDLDTTRVHYVKVPENHIVIDFDLVNETGEKDMEENLRAASEWPPTYAEVSKSGGGLHLHYIYDGDVSKLKRVYSDGIEVKVYSGGSSLRRRLTLCNDTPPTTISSGLPLKEERVIDPKKISSEKSLRQLIQRNLRKEIMPGTKPSVDFIHHILEEAYESDLSYDVTDMRNDILVFAINSTHHKEYCAKKVKDMKLASEDANPVSDGDDSAPLVIFDVEVFPNLFLVNWKKKGGDQIVRMVNPTADDIEKLLSLKLVGFNCRRYDNHILYGRFMGYDNTQLYHLSKRIISGDRSALFREAYGISYLDVYDVSSKKQSLKLWEIELGIHHKELGLSWDEPVDESLWDKVSEYCDNDVTATEVVLDHIQSDVDARRILSELSGLTMNDSTNSHTARIIFGTERHPQESFVYTDLREMFPGYEFKAGKSTYRGYDVGEGGFVYSEPGMYENVALLDVASMHPSSIENLNLFGPYTEKFSGIKNARLAAKHHDHEALKHILDGALLPYVGDEQRDKALANALKIVINSVYGLTAARFENPFRDNRNVDNIVAKRGALFMIDLLHAVQDKGYKVVHIKTDSIKIANPDDIIVEFVYEFGRRYGYEFEHECTYERMCLVNDAVYIAYYDGHWSATGAQFQHPYVFKKLFSREPVEFGDICEAKQVTTSMYLDMNEGLAEDEHNYIFVGRVGLFVPVKPGTGGGTLVREKDGSYYAVGGTKGYRWLEAEMVQQLGRFDDVDYSYPDSLVDKAVDTVSKYGDCEWFVDI